MEEKCQDLPEECWELIFDRLRDERWLEYLSLVCKQFLSISNRIRSSLTVSDLTVQAPKGVSGLFQRFQQLKRIDLVDFHGDLDLIVLKISQSGLNLEALNVSKQKRFPAASMKELGKKMTSLRVLICSRLHFLHNSDLITIANSFPFLEELDISHPVGDLASVGLLHPVQITGSNQFPGAVTDAGIVELSSKLRNLCLINLSGNHFLSDNSLVALSKNCSLLSELTAKDCSFISQKGICFVMKNSPNLVALRVNGSNISYHSGSPSLSIESCLFDARALSCLDLSQMVLSDDFLCSIAEANIRLRNLTLSSCRGYTITGILTVLRGNQSVNYLNLEGADFLTDNYVLDLIQYLRNLVTVVISSCSNLTIRTFFHLARNCHLLEDVQMERTGLGKEEIPMDLSQNRSIRSLKLAQNKCLNDKTLQQIGSACPELRLLDVSHCWSITKRGIMEIGKSCHEIMELQVNGCAGVLNLGEDAAFSKLEVLGAAGSGIGDHALLKMTDRNCRCLKRLNLEGCLGVTERGVKELLLGNRSKALREVNLKNCNVDADVLAWMVFSRPSLRKIISPCPYALTQKQKDLFLRHRCLIING